MTSSPKRRTRIAWLIGVIVLMGVGMMVWGSWDEIRTRYQLNRLRAGEDFHSRIGPARKLATMDPHDSPAVPSKPPGRKLGHPSLTTFHFPTPHGPATIAGMSDNLPNDTLPSRDLDRRIQMNRVVLVLLVFSLALVPGCSTLENILWDHPELGVPQGAIYGGARSCFAAFKNGDPAWLIILPLDYPPSFVLDTILLLFTIPYYFYRMHGDGG